MLDDVLTRLVARMKNKPFSLINLFEKFYKFDFVADNFELTLSSSVKLMAVFFL